MGYERNDRRFGGGSSEDRNRSEFGRSTGGYGRDQYGAGSRDPRGERFDDDRSGRRDNRDYGRDPSGYDYQDRGFFNRAGDEVRSWFGDDDAERRRRADDRHYEREQGRNYPEGGRFAPYGSGGSGYGFGGGGFGGSGYGDNGGGYSPSDYGAGRGGGATSNWGLGAGRDRQDWGRDTGYHSWRDRQIQALDQDYDDYRREHQQKFDTEFHGWRQNRQGQRDQLRNVQEHMEVVGSDGQHVGKVDHVRGDQIKLAKNDQDAKGQHHYIPVSWIQSVDDKVTISKTADQAKQHWRDEQRNGGSDFIGGSHQIDRSFSGVR